MVELGLGWAGPQIGLCWMATLFNTRLQVILAFVTGLTPIMDRQLIKVLVFS